MTLFGGKSFHVDQQVCTICQVGRVHIYLLLSNNCAKLPRVCAVGWCLRWTEKALYNRPRCFRNPMVPLMDVISLTVPAWVSVTKMVLPISTHTPIGWENDVSVDLSLEFPSFPPTRGFELYLVTCCVYKHNTSVVCINMGASKTVGSSVAQQNVSTEAGHFNSYNSIRITLMGNVEDVVAEAHRQYFSATHLGTCRK